MDRELIIAIIDKADFQNVRKVIKYGLFSPLTGEYLNSDTICKDEKITITDSIEDKLLEARMNLQVLTEFVNEGIDIFNMSSPFYNDVCFQYKSKKDIALKDRILEYFPNITLCEEGCDLMGVNMTTITAICECYFSESKKEDALKDKVLDQAQVGALGDIISKSNIYVIKCINLILKSDLIKKAYGSYIILGFITIEIICTIIFFKKDIILINEYMHEITNKYIDYLGKKGNKINYRKNERNQPDKIFLDINKRNEFPQIYIRNKTEDNRPVEAKLIIKKKKPILKNTTNKHDRNIKTNEIESKDQIHTIKKKVKICNINNFDKSKEKRKPYNYKIYSEVELSNSSNNVIKLNPNSEIINGNNDLLSSTNIDKEINIEEFLETQFDDMEYDEAIKKDHRKFGECYKEKIKDNQIIINIFFSYEPIRPKSIKIIFLILQIDLYFFVNGLFYDEEYISNIYHLEKDTFFTMAERFFENLIYAALAGILINYIIEFFFIEEKKIKKIFKFNKDNIIELKCEINKILKSIKRRYLFFIIISFIISLITLVHISCFNIVYNHTMVEWLIFSLIIILSIQIGTFLICLLQAALRCIGLKCKSEKLYKLSL